MQVGLFLNIVCGLPGPHEIYLLFSVACSQHTFKPCQQGFPIKIHEDCYSNPTRQQQGDEATTM